MIERILKIVKSNNKKRGRNITVGAVVGFLLSCTAVMGADEYLWIKNDGGAIKFSTNNSTPSNIENPYGENTWDGVDYVNNITLNSTSTDYGLKLEGDLGSVNFTNNGLIESTRNSTGYGIYNNGTIGNIINIGSIIGMNTGSGASYGIYNKGTMKNITNTGSIIGINTENGDGYGIYNNKGIIGNIANIGLVAGTRNSSYGIMNNQNSISILSNSGLIIAMGKSDGRGIYLQGGTTTVLTNEGLIIGFGGKYEGIGIAHSDGAESLINSGSIIGTGKTNSYGISLNVGIPILTNIGLIMGKTRENSNRTTAGIRILYDVNGIVNSGSIIGTNVGGNAIYGIWKDSSTSTLKAITNTGVIYGETSAIKNQAEGRIISIDNYGILVTKGSSVIDNAGTIINTPNHYGLQIKNGGASSGDITTAYSGDNVRNDIIVGNDGTTDLKRNMTIKNNTAADGSGSINGDENDSILNALKNTYEVTGTNKVTGSIINAYEEAVVFNTTDKQLTLSGTIVNGGIKDNTFAVKGSSGADTLILQAGDITYAGSGSPVSQNTVINGNIDMKVGDDILTVGTGTTVNGNINMGNDNDTLTIEKGSIINGTLDGGSGNDTLNFGETGVRAVPSSDEKINILHNISDFETINIDSNVTFFEKTAADDGNLKNLTISGVNEINISTGSVLNLRIDSAEITSGRYEGHALFGNAGLIINGDASKLGAGESITESENGIYNVGVLNLVTNGLGLNSIIAMDGITLDEDLFTKTNSILDKAVILKTDEGNGKAGDIKIEADKDIFREVKASSQKYEKLNDIYNGIISSTDDNFIALKNIITINSKTEDYTSVTDSEQLAKLLAYLGDIYTGSPYSYSSELSRRSMGMFRDIVTENSFRPDVDKWLIMGGLTHADGGTKDTYYGRNYHGFDTGTSDTKADMKLTGGYALGKYGYSENVSLGVAVGGNRSEAEMSMSKVKGSSGYIGAFTENYRGNLTLKAGAGIQYSEYDADRATLGGHSYDEKYSDMSYDIYLNGRYSHNIGDNLFLEPYGTLSYTYVDQDSADEGSKALSIETDSKSFDYTSAKVGVDLKKVISHEKGKSTLSAGVSYTKLLNGADEEYITGRFKGGSDFDILVAHKNGHSIGLNGKYTLELENGVIFDVKGTYSAERDSHNGTGKNKTKGEWIVGAGLGYKF